MFTPEYLFAGCKQLLQNTNFCFTAPKLIYLLPTHLFAGTGHSPTNRYVLQALSVVEVPEQTKHPGAEVCRSTGTISTRPWQLGCSGEDGGLGSSAGKRPECRFWGYGISIIAKHHWCSGNYFVVMQITCTTTTCTQSGGWEAMDSNCKADEMEWFAIIFQRQIFLFTLLTSCELVPVEELSVCRKPRLAANLTTLRK